MFSPTGLSPALAPAFQLDSANTPICNFFLDITLPTTICTQRYI